LLKLLTFELYAKLLTPAVPTLNDKYRSNQIRRHFLYRSQPVPTRLQLLQEIGRPIQNIMQSINELQKQQLLIFGHKFVLHSELLPPVFIRRNECQKLKTRIGAQINSSTALTYLIGLMKIKWLQ